MRRAALLVTCCVLGALLASCGEQGSQIVAYFSDVGDLVPDSQVQVSDVEVGSVDDIELVLDDGRMAARVTISIDGGVSIPRENLGAVIRQTSLLGEQFVELLPDHESGGAPVDGRGATIPLEATDRRVDVETFLADLAAFVGQGGVEDLNAFTHAQALILEDRGRRFGQVLDELSSFTDVLAARKLDVQQAVDHLASASQTIASNRSTLDSFLDSLEDANALLAEQGDDFGRLFRALRRFGTVNARFLARNERNIDRQIKALRPVFKTLAGVKGELGSDLTKLARFMDLFPDSLGSGPGARGAGDYVQADAVICETLSNCHADGREGDVPGQGRR
ncbi:MAG: MCE family protein [Actinomycetota bacterium]